MQWNRGKRTEKRNREKVRKRKERPGEARVHRKERAYSWSGALRYCSERSGLSPGDDIEELFAFLAGGK
jgi:hypothetical protein